MGSKKKEEHIRVKTLLLDTVTLMCKNGLTFKKNLKVQGLLGITVDDDEVFIVHLNETLGDLVSASDPNQRETQTPTKDSESGRKSPKRKRRRRSTDSNRSLDQSDNYIDLDPTIEIKTEPDLVLVDEVKYEGTPSKQSCRYRDEGLNFAIGSISSQNISFPGGTGDTVGGGAPPNTTDRFNPLNISATDSVTTSTGHQPFVTGMIPNVADTSNQSSADGSFQWDSSAAQGIPGMSNWASQITQQTMSPSDMSQQPGPSQGYYSPGQRTGTVGVRKLPERKERNCVVCSGKFGFGRRRSRTVCVVCGLGLHLDCAQHHYKCLFNVSRDKPSTTDHSDDLNEDLGDPAPS